MDNFFALEEALSLTEIQASILSPIVFVAASSVVTLVRLG